MKKIYMTPEMEILDTEIEGGILAGSAVSNENEGGTVTEGLGRQDGAGFDEDEEDF